MFYFFSILIYWISTPLGPQYGAQPPHWQNKQSTSGPFRYSGPQPPPTLTTSPYGIWYECLCSYNTLFVVFARLPDCGISCTVLCTKMWDFFHTSPTQHPTIPHKKSPCWSRVSTSTYSRFWYKMRKYLHFESSKHGENRRLTLSCPGCSLGVLLVLGIHISPNNGPMDMISKGNLICYVPPIHFACSII